MDEARLANGDKAYAAGDWRAAAREYLAAVHDGPAEGTGRAYHMAGNALIKLRRNSDASTVYGHGLKDESYDKRAVVFTNLGAALAADARYSDSVEAYRAAIDEPGNDAPWKAQQGLAGALFDMGRYDEACQAYREATWAQGNPDPGRALNNLGMCFMALGKPEDAIEAYKAAVNVAGYAAKGRASANLGLAYAAMGFGDEALRALEAAREEHGYELTGAALAAYEAAKATSGPLPGPEKVEGWSTGELPPVADDTVGGTPWVASGPFIAPVVDEEEATFFTRTEDEARVAGKQAAKDERRAKTTRPGLALRIGIAVLVVVLVLGGVVAAWYLGVGYPTQSATVSGMVDAYKAGSDYASYWVAVPQTDIKQEMRLLPARFDSYTVDRVDGGPTTSAARIVIRLQKNATLTYQISLVREGVGWKVNGITNDWRSTGGGS
ncbi:MAG: tetratricopeptide repeat protein [Coriobacteriia bacterium]|nr:tetratricopeptide repeat protein [Coriobacteriia bacterium]